MSKNSHKIKSLTFGKSNNFANQQIIRRLSVLNTFHFSKMNRMHRQAAQRIQVLLKTSFSLYAESKKSCSSTPSDTLFYSSKLFNHKMKSLFIY